jgi:hypothetical protein
LIDSRAWGTKEHKPNKSRGREAVAIDLSGGNPEMDYAQAEGTYKQFIQFTKVAIVFLVLLLAGMAFFLT